MSNKVYGFCDAGCRYRVPTYDEFVRGAYIVAMKPTADGYYIISQKTKYRVFFNEDAIKLRVAFECLDGNGEVILSKNFIFHSIAYTDGAEYVDIEITSASLEYRNADATTNITIEGYANGEPINFSTTYNGGSVYNRGSLMVEGAKDCCVVNPDATIKADYGDSAYEVAVKNGFEGTEEEWLASLRGERGLQGEKGDAGEVAAEYRFANALKGSLSGEVVTMDDVTPLNANVQAKVTSKNLIPYPYAQTTRTESGITFTDNGDGSITVKGTATANAVFYLYNNRNECPFVEQGEYYSRNMLSVQDGVSFVVNYYPKNHPNAASYSSWLESGTAQTPIDFEGCIMYLVVLAGATVDTTVYPMFCRGKTAGKYAPPLANGEAVTVKSCGKNLIPYPWLTTSITLNGLTFTDNKDGTLSISGTATAMTSFALCNELPLRHGATYSVSGKPEGFFSSNGNVFVSYKDDTGTSVYKYSGVSFTWDDRYKLGQVYIQINAGAKVGVSMFRPMVEVGTTATEYEPYIEGETITTAIGESIELDPIAPNMTITTDKAGALISAEYSKDTNKVIEKLVQAIISLGGTV